MCVVCVIVDNKFRQSHRYIHIYLEERKSKISMSHPLLESNIYDRIVVSRIQYLLHITMQIQNNEMMHSE